MKQNKISILQQLVIALLLLPFFHTSLHAQPANYPMAAQIPAPVLQANVSAVGVKGLKTYYYFFVARYPIGNSISSPGFVISNANATLSSSNYVLINWTIPSALITGFDVIRLTTPNIGAGSCSSCLVMSNTLTSTFRDQSNSTLGNYTFTTAAQATVNISLDNASSNEPQLKFDANPPSRFLPGNTFDVDFSITRTVKPFRTVTTLPLTCSAFEVAVLSPGGGVYECIAGTWTLISGGGGGGICPGGSSGDIQYNNAGNCGGLAPVDDAALIGNGTIYQTKILPDCVDTAGNHLNYATAGNTFSCGNSASSGGAGGQFTITRTSNVLFTLTPPTNGYVPACLNKSFNSTTPITVTLGAGSAAATAAFNLYFNCPTGAVLVDTTAAVTQGNVTLAGGTFANAAATVNVFPVDTIKIATLTAGTIADQFTSPGFTNWQPSASTSVISPGTCLTKTDNADGSRTLVATSNLIDPTCAGTTAANTTSVGSYDPMSFPGNTAVSVIAAPNDVNCFEFVIPFNFTFTKGAAHGFIDTGHYSLAIYNATGGAAAPLIVQSDTFAGGGAPVDLFTFASTTLTGGKAYLYCWTGDVAADNYLGSNTGTFIGDIGNVWTTKRIFKATNPSVGTVTLTFPATTGARLATTKEILYVKLGQN